MPFGACYRDVAWARPFDFSFQAVSTIHVNLMDLVLIALGFGENIQIFKSERELSKYTNETKKFFPKKHAKDGGVLRALRRHILNPRESRSRRGQRPLDPTTRTTTTTQSRAFHSGVPIGTAGLHFWSLPSPPSTLPCHSRHMTSSSTFPWSQWATPSYSALPLPTSSQLLHKGCASTTCNSCHVTSHMGHPPPPPPLVYSFPPLKLLPNSHDRLIISCHRLISRIGRVILG